MCNLFVCPEKIKSNIDKKYGVIFSQRVLLTLIDKGMSREDAYGIVQQLAMQAWEEAKSFQALLEGNSSVTDKLTPSELKDCFDTIYHLKNVDMIFDRLGLK